MKIATLQYAPKLAQPSENIARATTLLQNAVAKSPSGLRDVQLLVLPELAFSGYNFKGKDEIAPFLEPSPALGRTRDLNESAFSSTNHATKGHTEGRSLAWAREWAARLGCCVAVGYPEICSQEGDVTETKAFNSLLVVGPDGQLLANYRKSFLYYTDETWADEGSGFWQGGLSLHKDGPSASSVANITSNGGSATRGENVIKTSMGICMDINPYRFTAPWDKYEFANQVIFSDSRLAVLSMAWLTHASSDSLKEEPLEPDMDTLKYWIERFAPLLDRDAKPIAQDNTSSLDDGEVLLVMANRCGEEDDARYAGSSCVMGVRDGMVKVYDILGKGEEGVLEVDTEKDAKFILRLVKRPEEGM